MKDLQILPTPEDVAQRAADLFCKEGSKAIQSRGKYTVALSGGSTPLKLYRILKENAFDDRLDWGRIEFFWGDERTVPPVHVDSNYFQAAKELLIPRAIDHDRIHRIKGELDPAVAAKEYQNELLTLFQSALPRFDLILLGMGSDSHTASLFPDTDLVVNPEFSSDLLVGANWVSKLKSWRVTFTPQLINQARNVIFLVSGEGKAAALKSVLEGEYRPERYPAQLIKPADGRLIWLVDQEAAAQLRMSG